MKLFFVVSTTALLSKNIYRSRCSTILKGSQDNNINNPWSRRDFLAVSSLASTLQVDLPLGSLIGSEPANAVESASATDFQDNFQSPNSVIPYSTRRQYKHVTLSNGLKVLLVNDKEAIRASAALSIYGAGQFDEDVDIGGLAHLMEHMVSCASKEDFEDWLSNFDGSSNAFTAPKMVCYHFNVPPEFFSKSLLRFAALFQQKAVERACRNEGVLRREIKRVDSELNFENDFNRMFYLLKSLANPSHPFSRFTQGCIKSLEQIPKRDGINIGERLINFFKKRYQPSKAVLVVVSPADLDSLEKWTSPFSSILSRENVQYRVQKYPSPLKYGSKPAQYVVWHPKDTSPIMQNMEKLSINWLLERNYDNSEKVITSTTIGFFLAQLISRRDSGSIYSFLLRRNWIPEGNQGVPRITLPIDVSGFQLMRLEIVLTIDGFLNRAAVVAAIYDSLQEIVSLTRGSYNIPTEFLKKTLSMARLHGYNIAPRPPDPIELAVDAQTYGFGGTVGVGVPGIWPQLPAIDDTALLNEIRKGISDVLRIITDPRFATITITASNDAIFRSRESIFYDPIPPPLDPKWNVEAISGTRYLTDDLTSLTGKVEEWIGTRIDGDAMSLPSPNPWLPLKLRPARQSKQQAISGNTASLYFLDSAFESVSKKFGSKNPGIVELSWKDPTLTQDIGTGWQLYQADGNASDGLQIPILPDEPTCRCAMVIQLLSQRPARANVNQAGLAQLWLFSFEEAIKELAELGTPAGLAYELTFNKYGLRICILGISQNLSSYTQRLSQRLIGHHNKLMLEKGIKPTVIERAVAAGYKQRSLSNLRKRKLEKEIRQSSPQEVSREGKAFLASCASALCLVQGDVLTEEATSLVGNLKEIFDTVKTRNEDEMTQPAVPQLREILYNPLWKPRTSSLCLVAGAPLISDVCGRIPR
eukprot:CAMPEP_0194141690 /NCGR_PEP_ID=MMETSP0152-20130528/11083_1 /TAXON_ID=1049557 /ORGANISM="Thalassiothrix antarctica, Strain L6-D1" /LENGTH=926 /DNA_ID=CAMNT_0038840397 /DNA_START=188 /DNA_END=2968 /DNA_ORIENTATION=-